MYGRRRHAAATLLSFCLIVSVAALPKPRAYGDACNEDFECKRTGVNLRCTHALGDSVRRCHCVKHLEWSGKDCAAGSRKNDEEGSDAARVIVILVPILAGAFLVICIAFMCCYWIQITAKDVSAKETKTTKYGKEIDFNAEDADDEESEEDESEEESDSEEEEEVIEMTTIKRKASETNGVPQLKVNGLKESTLSKPSNGSVPNGDVINGHAKSLAPEAPIVNVNSTPMKERETGYQASMRQLLTMPMNSSEPNTRPMSAHFISNTRPGTAIRTDDLLKPKQRPKSAAGRPVGYIGPYVSDSNIFRARPMSPRPFQMSKPEELADLYDKIAAVAEKEEKKKEDEHENAKKKLNIDQGSGLEEIRLVKVAVKAFKKRRNMKKVKEDQKRRKKKNKKFESLVDQIMRIRLEEERKPKPILRKKRRDSKGSDSSNSRSGSSASRPTLSINGRPESVAQRVLRERTQKQIKARTVTTAKHKPPPIATRKRKEKEEAAAAVKPLHVALRMNKAKKGSRSQLTERIKQQVHLNAVKNYQYPLSNLVANKPIEIISSKDPTPVRSILKKSGGSNGALPNGGSHHHQERKKSGRVNIAFQDDVDANGSTTHSVKAEVYVIHD